MNDAAFIACPSHDGRISAGTSVGMFAASDRLRTFPVVNVSSLLTFNCNCLFLNAINQRQAHGIKWFAMIHSDVQPEPLWLDHLVGIAEEHDADFVSAVVAIKDDRLLTSTAIARTPDDRWLPRRLTFGDVASLPETFAAADVAPECPSSRLLCNTGLCLMRLDRRWLDPAFVHFDSPNRMLCPQGEWTAGVIPEDWYFTAAIADVGGKVMATRAVRTIHHGAAEFPSSPRQPQ